MKASDVLVRYAAGERNFQRVNLRGQSFRGENLSGVDFSEADLRSTDLSNANLTGANFTGAKCGLQRRWAIFILIFSWLLSAILAVGIYVAAVPVALIFDSSNIFDSDSLALKITGWIITFILITLLILILRKGIRAVAVAVAVGGIFSIVITLAAIFPALIADAAIGAKAVPVALSLAAVTISIFVLIPIMILAKARVLLEESVVLLILIIVATILFAGAGYFEQELEEGAITGAVMVPFTIALTLAACSALGISFVLALTVGSKKAGILAVVFASSLVILISVGAVIEEQVAFLAIGVFGLAILLVIAWISWRAFKGDERDTWIRSSAITIAALGGTKFYSANLLKANLASTKLKNADFRKADLAGVRWYGAKKLDSVRPGNTYLQNAQVRQWLTGKGVDKNFDHQNLRGINLQGANLTDASFIGADLSEANLQDTDLSRAKLVQTQLDKTDFTGATLTGAYIEDWGITADTKLEGVKCECVFMRLPTKENPNPRRKPDNENDKFEDDDFADFIKPIVDTLDLYHNQGIDPRAIAISWKQLVENNPEANLQFAAMEVKGKDNLLLRFKAALKADLSHLNAEYFNIYNYFKALADAESKKLIVEKDNRIQQLEKFVMTGLNSPKFQNIREIKMSNDYSRTQNISGGTINNSGAGAFSLGDISGTVANTINQLPNFENEPDKKELKELLDQLQTAVKEAELDEEEKAESLEQIQAIASSLTNTQDGAVKKTAKRAMKLLRGTAAALPPSAAMVTICNQLPDLIAKIF